MEVRRETEMSCDCKHPTQWMTDSDISSAETEKVSVQPWLQNSTYASFRLTHKDQQW